jgi:hypothetical protein
VRYDLDRPGDFELGSGVQGPIEEQPIQFGPGENQDRAVQTHVGDTGVRGCERGLADDPGFGPAVEERILPLRLEGHSSAARLFPWGFLVNQRRAHSA